ncbi:Sec-independent protein translocase protein TatB [Stenotrophomonas sp.]|uniref:Sec-independent protein translocase protein TatB n=1 Tax=Stenotrophomonas sp. TaxID=69392 RepID=UPI0028AF1A19|nr:Sec-independent protein translocase protein TatB [Stenotrophomonas sp.]
MFDIGFGELLLIAVVALVVLGPERLPKAARFAGLWVRRARNQWDSVKQELERELHAEELKRNLQDVRQSMQQAESGLRDQARQVQDDADALGREVEQVPATETVIEPRPIAPRPVAAEATAETPAQEAADRALTQEGPASPAQEPSR